MRNNELRSINIALNSGAFAVNDGATTYNIATALNVTIDGVHVNKGTVTGGATPTAQPDGTALTPLQPDKACALVWAVNAGGTVGVFQGPIVDVDPDTDVAEYACDTPDIPDSWCAFATHKIQTSGASSLFTIGASNWDATGVTDVIANIATLSDRPITTATA